MGFKESNSKRSEYLSNDILEADFIHVFRPFLSFQRLMGSSRVDARDQFVTPVSLGQKFYSGLTSIITVFISYSSAYLILIDFSTHSNIYYLAICAIMITTIVYFCNILHVRFFNADANVKLYINMQNLDRLMGVEHNADLNKMLYRSNVLAVSLLLMAYCLLISGSFAGGFSLGLGFVGISWTTIPCLFEMTYCFNLILYFLMRLRFINAILSNHIQPFCIREGYDISKLATKCAMTQIAKSHSFQSNNVHIYLKRLVIGYNEFAGLYKFQVLLFFINYILYILLDVQFGITGLKMNVITFQQWLASVAFLVIGLFVSILLCIRCELFLRELKTTKRLAVAIMSRHLDGPIREKAKIIINIIEQTPPRFSVYDMWDMDARKLLIMFNIVTTMLVTQLQFAFL